MKNEKILIFDEDGLDPRLPGVFKNKLNNPNLEIIFTDYIDDFRIRLKESHYSIVLINLHTPFFWDSKLHFIKTLIQEVALQQRRAFQFMVCAVAPAIVQYAADQGVQVVLKGYDVVGLRQLFHSPVSFVLGEAALSIENITKIVTAHTGVLKEEITSPIRKRDLTYVRHICMFLSKRYIDTSLKDIGEYFGGRDHTTVIHAHTAIKDSMDTNEIVRGEVQFFMDKIEETFGCLPLPEKEKVKKAKEKIA